MRQPLLAALLLTLVFVSRALWADDFRIESKVYSGKHPAPISQSTTLFSAGIVYDYLVQPPRVAVFDKPRGRFILLDPDRELRTDVDIAEVARFTRELRDFAQAHGAAHVKAMLDPKLEPAMNDKTGELVLTGPSLSYRLETIKPESAEAVQQYREFSDWYVRMNPMLNPAATPPFPRLAVNEELARRGLVAEKVHLTVSPQVSMVARGVSLRSEHIISWRLLPRDMDDIAKTAQQLATFKVVPFAEFRGESGK